MFLCPGGLLICRTRKNSRAALRKSVFLHVGVAFSSKVSQFMGGVQGPPIQIMSLVNYCQLHAYRSLYYLAMGSTRLLHVSYSKEQHDGHRSEARLRQPTRRPLGQNQGPCYMLSALAHGTVNPCSGMTPCDDGAGA